MADDETAEIPGYQEKTDTRAAVVGGDLPDDIPESRRTATVGPAPESDVPYADPDDAKAGGSKARKSRDVENKSGG